MQRMDWCNVFCGRCGAVVGITDSDHDLCASRIGIFCQECGLLEQIEEAEEERMNVEVEAD